jgi:hypothetical protein
MGDTRQSSGQSVSTFRSFQGRLLRDRARRRPAALRRATVEGLEDRRLLAADTPIISEFLAVNNSGIQDEDGNRSDWIELYNPTAADINLDGYYLTDDATALSKWRLPAVTIRSNGYQLVWASGKDRVDPAKPLHANFSLDGAGEYLALVAPDGVTPITQFAPTFPPQGSDVSYGVVAAQTTQPLIGPATTARTRIPTASDNMTAWLSPTFDDSTWIAGKTGVGYETDSPPPAVPGFRTRMVDVNPGTRTDIASIDDALSILNGTFGTAYTVASDTTVVKTLINMGQGGAFGGDQVLPNGAATADTYAIRATSTVTIPAGDWTINVNSDDGFRLRIPGVTFDTAVNNGELVAADTFQYSPPRGPANTFATFTVPAGGLTATLQLDFYENGGGDEVELSIAQGKRTSFSTSTFTLLANNVLGWTASDPTTVGPPNYRALLGTDVQAQMFNVNTTALVRVPFSVASANDFDTLRLQMKYDDGFVAYINGVEVARRLAPATLAWNSAATAGHPDDQALVYESISIPATALRTGSNVLAIQVLNNAANSSDLLIYPELQGFRSTIGTDPKFFATPTPGAANVTPPSLGVVADTKFSVDRGFFDAPFQLAITTATEGATIRYTTDGTVPTATNGVDYTGPLTISRTTTLRAAAFKTGYVSTNSDTQTYIFLDDVIRQAEGVAPGPNWPAPGRVNGQVIDYGMDQGVVNANLATIKNDLKTIPTFSIVMNNKDLFDPASGIYVNPSGDGRQWERPASIELIYPDGTKGFQIDAGLRIRGGFSRSGDNPKHAFRFFFRNEYDGNLKYPMFGPNGAQSFNGFDLRTFQNYSWSFQGDASGTFMRDQLNRDLQLAMGHDAERGNYYHLYINGQYWGLYDTAERPEANHGADYFGGDSEDYDVIKVDPDLGYNIEATDGNMDAWNQLYSLLSGASGPVTEAILQRAQGNNPDGTRNPAFPVLLDVDNLIDYMLVIYWGGNKDAPISDFLGNTSPNNFFAVRNRNGDQGFQFYVHDAEHTMLPWEPTRNRLGPDNQPGVGWAAGSQGVSKSSPQYFFQQLWNLPSFKMAVADHVQKHMVNPGGVLTPQVVQQMSNRRKAEIDRAVVGESARWGDSKVATSYTRQTWLNAVANVDGWISGRTATVLDQLKRWGLFPSFNAPRFSQQGGQVPLGYQLTLTVAPGTPAGAKIYYTLDGSDPRRPDGSVSPTALLYGGAITINDTTRVNARTLSGATWSALNSALFTIDLAAIRITEVMYNPAPAPAGSTFSRGDFEFLEVMNTGPTERDLTGVKIAGGIGFTFPDNYRLAAGARAVVVKNLAAFQSRYGTAGIDVVPGVFSDQLSDGGEALQIQSATGQVSLNFTYNDSWYPQTDGEGFSLNIINPLGALASWNVKQSWAPSLRAGGTPGAPSDALGDDAVIVNEVLASPEPGSPTGDFIELRNSTAAPVDVSGWFLSDSAANLKKFRIPAGSVIAAGGYLLFTQQELGFDIAPDVAGEAFVSAGDAAGNLLGYRASKRYAVGETGFSFGEFTKSTGGTDFVQLASPTPGAPNGLPRVGPVVINELMYYPPSFATEFIELRNLTGSDVVLNDPADPASAWKFVDGISYTFPAGATIPAFGFALLIPTDEETFRSLYSVPRGVPIFGPYQLADGSNNLADAGENLTLYRPTAAGDMLVDRVNYTAAAPWPTGAGNTGYSIARVDSAAYGNDAGNWRLETRLTGTPGRINLDTQGPTADVVDVAPDPRTTPVDAVTITFSEPVKSFDLADLRLTRDGGPNLLTAAQTLTSADGVNWTLAGLSGLTGAAGTYTLTLTAAGSGITDWSANALSADASDTWRVGGLPAGRVAGRHVFYNNSAFDGGSAAAGAQDDGAVATDKQALLPGQTAAFANYTSYSRGINGLMVDVAGLAGDLTAADFQFKVGKDSDFANWVDAPAPLSVTRRAGAGTGGSDRVTILWADGAIRNQWLRVTVLANARTALPAPDVFYFGNLVGETGDSAAAAVVTAADVAAVRADLASPSTLPPTSATDLNRDGRVNATDYAIVRGAMSRGALALITAPAVAPASVASATLTRSAFSDTVIAPIAPARSQPVRRTILTSDVNPLEGGVA